MSRGRHSLSRLSESRKCVTGGSNAVRADASRSLSRRARLDWPETSQIDWIAECQSRVVNRHRLACACRSSFFSFSFSIYHDNLPVHARFAEDSIHPAALCGNGLSAFLPTPGPSFTVFFALSSRTYRAITPPPPRLQHNDHGSPVCLVDPQELGRVRR